MGYRMIASEKLKSKGFYSHLEKVKTKMREGKQVFSRPNISGKAGIHIDLFRQSLKSWHPEKSTEEEAYITSSRASGLGPVESEAQVIHRRLAGLRPDLADLATVTKQIAPCEDKGGF